MKVREKIKNYFSQYPETRFRANHILLKPNQEIKEIFYLKSGYVRMYSCTLRAEEISITLFEPGSFFPLTDLICGARSNNYFEVYTDANINTAPAEDVMEFINSDIQVCREISNRFANALSRICLKTSNNLYRDAYYRIISILIYFANKYSEVYGSKLKTKVPFSNSQIASWTGLQRETVSRKMEFLNKKRMIEYEDHFIIIDLDKLEQEIKSYEYLKLKE